MKPEEYAIEHVIAILQQGRLSNEPVSALVAARSAINSVLSGVEQSDNAQKEAALRSSTTQSKCGCGMFPCPECGGEVASIL